MKKILFLLTIFTLLLATSSCSKDDDTPNSKFQGIWSGTYSGSEDNGTWQATISADGSLTGTVTSTDFSNVILQLNGTVNPQGILNSTYGNTFFTGQFTGILQGNTASGQWNNETQQISGTWSGTKQ